MPLNRQAVVMARHGVPIDRSVLADWMGRAGALIAPVVEHMAKRLMADSIRLYVDETTAPVLDPVGKALPKRLRETAYALAVEVAAADLDVRPEETRFLELLSDALELDALATTAIERGARARHATP